MLPLFRQDFLQPFPSRGGWHCLDSCSFPIECRPLHQNLIHRAPLDLEALDVLLDPEAHRVHHFHYVQQVPVHLVVLVLHLYRLHRVDQMVLEVLGLQGHQVVLPHLSLLLALDFQILRPFLVAQVAQVVLVVLDLYIT